MSAQRSGRSCLETLPQRSLGDNILLDPARSSPASVILVQTLVERKRSRRFRGDDRSVGDD
jgi:hypothetical protein